MEGSGASEFEVYLQEVLSVYCPGLQLKEKQLEALRQVYHNNSNLLVNLPTGYGKSVIFHILSKLLKLRDGKVRGSLLVFCPLTLIQEDQLEFLSQRGVSACRITSNATVQIVSDKELYDTDCSASALDVDEASDDSDEGQISTSVPLEDLKDGKFDIIFCHPEALFSTASGIALISDETFQSAVIATAIDECHCFILHTYHII